MSNPVLKADHLGISFGGLKAVEGFDLEIRENELVGLIGPNGAGKTTVFNMLTGVYQPTEGAVYLDGNLMAGKKPHQMVKAGIARTFQNIRLFKKMTVIDNVRVAFNLHMKYSVLQSILRTPLVWKEEEEIDRKARELLSVFNMEGLADHIAANLPYGQQRKLEIARALATNPKVLLLDEPAAGMNPTETAELMEAISIIRKRFHVSILLIEHDMKLVGGICEELTVLNFGRVLCQGKTSDVLNNPEVIKAYLGE